MGRTIVLVLLCLTACAGELAPASSDGLRVVTTTSILADVVGNVVGDAGKVVAVMPPGTDPHEFEPSPQQIEAMGSADLLVVNGLGLEEALSDAVAAAEEEGATVLSLAEQVDPIGQDPHFWHDPTRMAEAVRLIGAELGQVDAAGAYAAELESLDAEIAELLAGIPSEDRKLVTNHDAFGYFADRYDFEVVGALAEPSAAELERIAETIQAEGVPAIFTESAQSDPIAEALAGEAGVEVVELFNDSLGADADTYADMLRTNAERIADALG